MGENTRIQWTHHTFNPWWGCTKVSPGCAACYAEGEAKRRGFDVWGPDAERRFFSDRHWKEPLKWNRQAEAAGERRRVFCASMADVFEEREDLRVERARLFCLIEATPWLDWQVLTKRPRAMRTFMLAYTMGGRDAPPPNLWLGTSAENQQTLDARATWLLDTPAAVRFLSLEPLIAPVDLRARPRGDRTLCLICGYGPDRPHQHPGGYRCRGIDWIIVGGESGPKARVCKLEWIRAVRDQCRLAQVSLFVKQLGARPGGEPWHQDGDGSAESPNGVLPTTDRPMKAYGIWRLTDPKGGNVEEWPEDLRIRQFPVPPAAMATEAERAS